MRVSRIGGAGGPDVWLLAPAHSPIETTELQRTAVEARAAFAARAEVAAVIDRRRGQTMISDLVLDLIGFDRRLDGRQVDAAQLRQWLEKAASRGLVRVSVDDLRDGGHWRSPVESGRDGAASDVAFTIGIDAEWLLGGESGAQVFAFELVRELAQRAPVQRLIMLSDSGAVPAALAGLPKVEGWSWAAALRVDQPLVDILHRPYQPGAHVDYRIYRHVGRCVLVTVLDFIAYDISAYHESEWAWQRYRSGFDEKARLADGLFAISEFVAARMRRQFGDVIAPVHAIRLGTDHLDGDQATPAAESADARALSGVPFLLVLGNDFQHKNRDFAVKVFAELRRRGYQGRLVLAGFHVDLGSTYGHELDGAGEAAASIVRRGSVSGADKRWLLANADAVIYPTSVEGFGLVPFEAAALGTPTAFVRFGPLAETMPSVAACPGWNVAAFVVHLEALIADPEPHVRAVMRAAASLTWRGHVDRTMAVYQELLRHPDRWRARRPPPPGRADKAWHVLDALQYRVRRKLGRMLSDLGTAARFANPSEP